MKKYNIIYADPAWSFGDRLRSSKKKDNGKWEWIKNYTTLESLLRNYLDHLVRNSRSDDLESTVKKCNDILLNAMKSQKELLAEMVSINTPIK